MRIAVVSGFSESLLNFRGSLLREMVKLGYEVIACGPEDQPEICQRLAQVGAFFRRIPLQRAGLNPLTDLKTLRCLSQLFRREQPTHVLAYTAKPVIYTSLAARMVGVPRMFSIITGLGYAFSTAGFCRCPIRLSLRVLYKAALARNKAIFFQNQDDRDLFQRWRMVGRASKLVLVNGSGVDLDHYQPIPPMLHPLRFLLIARLLKEKGIYDFVAAARLLRKTYPNARFRIIGPTESGPSSIPESQLAQWQAESLIEYYGWTADVRPHIAESSVYVLPSYREGTPRSVLEAMAMSRPIITTAVPGCRETVVSGENGFLVPPREPVRLSEAMEYFLTRPECIVSMGLKSRALAVSKYDVRDVNATILATMGL